MEYRYKLLNVLVPMQRKLDGIADIEERDDFTYKKQDWKFL